MLVYASSPEQIVLLYSYTEGACNILQSRIFVVWFFSIRYINLYIDIFIAINRNFFQLHVPLHIFMLQFHFCSFWECYQFYLKTLTLTSDPRFDLCMWVCLFLCVCVCGYCLCIPLHVPVCMYTCFVVVFRGDVYTCKSAIIFSNPH